MNSSETDIFSLPRPNFQAQKSGGVAYCPGYTDGDGNWNTGFPCKRWGGPDENYCCGDDKKRFCCPERPLAPGLDSNNKQLEHKPSTSASKIRSHSRSDQGDAPGWPPVNSDPQGEVITPSFLPEQNEGGIFQTLGQLSGNVNFPLVPAIIAFSMTAVILMTIVVVVCCFFCSSCPGRRKRIMKREMKASKFIKTTSVNMEAEETAAVIGAQALVSISANHHHSTYSSDSTQILPCYVNHNLMSGSSSATSSLPRGCLDFGSRGRQDNDQMSVLAQGCFHNKAPPVRGYQMRHHERIAEQLINSSSSLLGPNQYMRNSPTTTSTSNSSEGVTAPHPQGQPYALHGNNSALHCGCDHRPMNVENLVNALYQNNQHHVSDMGWTPDSDSRLMSMSSLTRELNGNLMNNFPSDMSNSGMDDNSIKKWLSSTNQQLTPKRSLFTKCPYHTDMHGGEASERLLGDQNFMQLDTKGIYSSIYPDVTQTCNGTSEKQPFLEPNLNHENDASNPYILKPDLTSSTHEEPGLSAIDVPNCPQLKLTSGEWRIPKLRFESGLRL